MKKYALILPIFVFTLVLFGFNTSPAIAYYDAGCNGTGPYSTLSGTLCDNSQYNPNYNQQYNQQYNQSYYPSNTQELSVGSRGQDVITLQQNLKDRGYYIRRADGIFGLQTRKAVINYQRTVGLPVTGIADVQTLASLNVTSPYNPYTPYVPPTCPNTIVNGIVTNTCGGVINSNLNIFAASLPNASMGTVYSASIQAAGGTGSYYWTLSSGSLPPGLSLVQAQCFSYPCQAPATISGTPTVSSGTYTFQVSLSDGISRAYQSFTIYVYGGSSQAPSISYLSPTSGVSGTQVTIYGSGFGYSNCTAYSCGNVASVPLTVNFGGSVIRNVYSYNGTSLTFTVPSYTTPACLYSYPACAIAQMQIVPGTYPVSITNSYGTSTAVNFIVTGYVY